MASDAAPAGTLAQSVRGAGWIIGWRVLTRAIGFCSTLVLVRLLTPGDFGLVTLASSLIQGLDGIIGFGVEGAIIRTNRVDRAIYDAGFTINVLRTGATSAALAAAAAPMARWFGNPGLTDAIYALAAGWALSGFQNIGMVEYRRTLAFDMEFKIKLIPRLLALAVTIPAAIVWRSHWALIAGIVATQAMTVALSYAFHPYRPRFGVAGMRHIFGFSFWEWLIGLLNLVGGRADTMIVGRLLGTAAVGVYGVGGEIATLPSGEIVAPLCRALFSGFVAEIRAGGTGAETLPRVLALVALVTFPLSVGLSLVAYPLTRVCFGDDWLAAAPLIEVLAVASALGLFGSVGEALFSAHAWLRTILALTAATTALRLALLAALIPRYGLLGGALTASVACVAQEVFYAVTAKRRLKLRLTRVLRGVARPALAVLAMAAALIGAGLGWSRPQGGTWAMVEILALATGLGAAVYVGALLLLWAAAGRPAGAEADVLAFLRRRWRRAG